MNGQMVNFPVNGTQAAGYLSEAKSGQGTGVLVLPVSYTHLRAHETLRYRVLRGVG